jgi:hypothetical protein
MSYGGMVRAMSTAARTVSVEFIDADTGRTFARSDLPADQLPDSFAPDTTLQLGDDPWRVERAEPLTAAQFVPAGRLVLTVRRLVSVPPREILYSLPTICDTVPAVGPAPTQAECLELHEDDWRQVELVSRSLALTVNAELDAIQRVYDRHGQRDAEGRFFGFREIHVRAIVPLAEPVPWPRLRELLPAAQHEYAGVRLRGAAGVVTGSFAVGGPLSWYGIAKRDLVSVIGLDLATAGGPVPATAIEPVLRAFDLVVVDWCRCAAIEPDGLSDYLRAIDTRR